MYLEIHDTETGNSLCGRVKNLDYDYQGEQWVQELADNDLDSTAKFRLSKIVLLDDQGQRAIWQVHENGDAELVEKAVRFTGEWVLNLRYTPKKR